VSKKPSKRKHIPQRTCVGCREVLPKRAMIRIVRNTNGVFVDLTGKLPGRGAYLHDVFACWEKGLKGSLAQALKIEISMEDQEKLSAFAKSFALNASEGKEN
jgi:predicted RNA-binding protein YlxR (DUF448 family)